MRRIARWSKAIVILWADLCIAYAVWIGSSIYMTTVSNILFMAFIFMYVHHEGKHYKRIVKLYQDEQERNRPEADKATV